MQLALTLDDAPTVMDREVPGDPTRMDTVRTILVDGGVKHCVAFVIGSHCAGNEPVLERWLAAGFELGNHCFDHTRARGHSPEVFRESLRRCDEILARLGAFDGGRQRWFRFPFLDRGAGTEHRKRLRQAYLDLGYAPAPASVEFYDHQFEGRMVQAQLQSPDESSEWRIGQRFVEVVGEVVLEANARASRADPPYSLVAFAHFGPTLCATLPALLHLFNTRGLEFCSLSSALAHPVYEAFERDMSLDGLVDGPRKRKLTQRVARRLIGLTETAGIFGQRRYGPLWPHRR